MNSETMWHASRRRDGDDDDGGMEARDAVPQSPVSNRWTVKVGDGKKAAIRMDTVSTGSNNVRTTESDGQRETRTRGNTALIYSAYWLRLFRQIDRLKFKIR